MATIRTVHILSHTHWDREWYLNSPYTNPWLVPFFDALFAMLEKEPGYRFVLDGQTALVEDWCEQLALQHRDAAAARQRLAGYVRQGRVCVGPYYLQPDWQLVSEEALVRNLLIGAKISNELGGRMPAGWLLDNFGQISQAPQIHRGFGLEGLFVWRGVEMDPREVRSEFLWESPDGSGVLAIYLVGSYRNGMRLAEYRQAMASRIRGEIEKLAPFATTPNVLLMNGYDQEMQPDDILPALRAGLPGLEGYQVVQSTPPEVLRAVRQAAPRLNTIRGALYSGRFISVFPGILSSRMYLKTQNDACQKRLEQGAEPLCALLWGLASDSGLVKGGHPLSPYPLPPDSGGRGTDFSTFFDCMQSKKVEKRLPPPSRACARASGPGAGARGWVKGTCPPINPDLGGLAPDVGFRGLSAAYPAVELEQAWKLLLQNHPHDSICGVSIDAVHTDMEARFARSGAISGRLAGQALATLAANVDTSRRPEAQDAWVVANPGLRPADGLVELPGSAGMGAHFADSDGSPLPAQPSAGGSWLVELRDVPALGLQAVYSRPASEAQAESKTRLRVDSGSRTLENAWVRLAVADDGSLELTDKTSQAVYAGLLIFEDGGDAGDSYNYSFPAQDRVLTSRGRPAHFEWLETGPLRARLRITLDLEIPTGLAPDRQARSAETCRLPLAIELTLEAGSPLVQFRVLLSNTARDHRLRVLFPSGLPTAVSQAETQFDVVTRPIRQADYDESGIPEHVRRVIVGAREPHPVTIFPQRSFVDLSDGARGLAVLNRGLPEYEVLPGRNTLALTLMRGVGWIARPDLLTRIGDAGPLIATPGGQCLRPMAFEFALLAHAGNWQSGQVLAAAERYNRRLWVAETGVHAGPLEPAAGFLELEDPSGQLKVTAVKRAEDGRGLLVRFFNPTDVAIPASLRSAFPLARAWRTDLAETNGEPLAVEGQHVARVSAAAHQIVTIRLEIEPLNLALVAPDSQAGTDFGFEPEPADFPAADFPVSISGVELQAESDRAALLEAELSQKEHELQGFQAQGDPEDEAGWLRLYRLRLEAASLRRTALEARLSATLLRLEVAPTPERGALEAELRRIGDAINVARVEKRALEYVVDDYAGRMDAK